MSFPLAGEACKVVSQAGWAGRKVSVSCGMTQHCSCCPVRADNMLQGHMGLAEGWFAKVNEHFHLT